MMETQANAFLIWMRHPACFCQTYVDDLHIHGHLIHPRPEVCTPSCSY